MGGCSLREEEGPIAGRLSLGGGRSVLIDLC